MAATLYFVGTAGSGKTTLTKAFKQWMENQGYQAVTVNLDPGADKLPYAIDIDVRDWVYLPEVMDEHELGPNGAQIVSADMVAMKAPEIKKVMDEFNTDYYLIDTPGQMELFTFREASREMVDTLGENSLITFLFDPVLSKQPSGFVSLMTLAATTQFRFDIPYFPVLSKSDILSQEELEIIKTWSEDFWKLDSALREKADNVTQASLELIKSIQNMGLHRGITPISSVDQRGLEDIYTAVQDAFYGGQDLETD